MAAKSGIALLFLQYASCTESLLGGGPFIVLRSHGISRIRHTYSEDMHSRISSATVVTPRRSRGVCKGAYPPRRCGISYTYAEGSVL